MAKVPKKVKELLEKIPPLLTEIAKAEILRAEELQHASDGLTKQIEMMETDGE